MIELRNVSKTYKSKKGKKTKALDNISLNFDEKGITFILGKSGSGKSTLLNVLGGLDKYDSGDMLILGKSSKEFTQADFDSYRNTYVGFVFQEFNILEDYDVYENIILALQLQQKTLNKEEIDKLLEKLELTELTKRKVNELSGGQKQRVAIARALIKNPKIILADEPTGNLDSKTGRQVMDLLKEIAKEKLVIIVSHDEEYAENYGDRIIEIKDGSIIRDTKDIKENKNVDNNYQIIKSKLPLKTSFKLGCGSLKHKKIKLAFTILLTIITLGFLSCTDTLYSYSYNKEHVKILVDRGEQFVQIEKNHIVKDSYGYSYPLLISMDDNSANKVKNIVKKEGFEIYQYSSDYSTSANDIFHVQRPNNSNGFYSFDENIEIVVASDISKILKEKVIGRNPQSANEVVISNQLADLMIKNGVQVHEITVKTEFKKSNVFEPKNYENIINAPYTYYFGESGKVKIVGIIDYDYAKQSHEYKANVCNKIYVSKDFITNSKTRETGNLKSYFTTDISIEGVKEKDEDSSTDLSANLSIDSSVLNHKIEYFNGTSWKKTDSLKENEVILNINQFIDNSFHDDLNNYTNSHYFDGYDKARKKFIANYIKDLNIIGKKVNLKIYYSNYGEKSELYKEFKNLTVIGVYEENHSNYEDNYYGNNNYFSKKLLQDYMRKPFEKVGILYPMTRKKDFTRMAKLFPQTGELSLKSTYSEAMLEEKDLFNSLQKIAFYVGLVFLVFTIILIANFMFTSISYRKKEIGVLRALGSRSQDVIKIFLWEGIVMSIIAGTIASILLVVVTNFLNSYVMSEMSIITTPFIVGIRQFIVIYLLVFAITMISSIIPILKISRMKPIDAILNK